MKATLRRLVISAFVITLFASGGAYILWQRGVIQAWVMKETEKTLVKVYNDKVRDHLPFKIENVQVKREWSELLTGRINKLALTLKTDNWKIRLEGPLSFPSLSWATFKQLFRQIRGLPLKPAEHEIRIDFSPIAKFEHITTPIAQHTYSAQDSPTPLALHLSAVISHDLTELREAGVDISAPSQNPNWRWAEHGVEIQNPEVHLSWKNDSDSPDFKAQITAKSFSWSHKTDPKNEQDINVSEPEIQAQIPLKIQPFEIGQLASIAWKAKGAEALFGMRYFALPDDPLHGKALIKISKTSQLSQLSSNLEKKSDLPEMTWSQLKLTLGKNLGHQLKIAIDPSQSAKQEVSAKVKWQLDPLALKEFIPAFIKATANAGEPFKNWTALQTIQFREGTISSQGEAQIPLQTKTHLPDFSKLGDTSKLSDANFKLENISLLWPSHQLAIKGLYLNLPITENSNTKTKRVEGELSISRFGFRKLRGRLRSTRISVQEIQKSSAHPNHLIRIGEKGSALPLDLDGLLFRVDSITGRSTKSEQGLQFELETAARLEPVSAEKILLPLCLAKSAEKVPPATLRVELPKIEISPGETDIDGYVRADLFNGFIQLDDLSVYDFLSEVPEIDFNLTMSKIELAQLGNWLNFGTMDGTLEGYARNVVFQSWLPTQYDFDIRVKPYRHSDVIFSPEAMKNFAKLFSEEGINHIPGYAQWFAFGLPSEILGGYNIDYAGIHIRSEDGFIRLETLDPIPATPTLHLEATDTMQTGRHQKHFILYSRRFKIPLNSSRYPLIVDAVAMGNFVHHNLKYLQSLSKNKKGEEIHANSNISSSDSDDENEGLPQACIPSDLSHL